MRVIVKVTLRDVGVTDEDDWKDNVGGHRCDR